MKLKISDIIIGERQRVGDLELDGLASMSDPDVGLILPIVVHKTMLGYELVDGRRRLAKAIELGWESIEVHEKDQLSVIAKQKSELYADIHRLDRSWQDRCLSVAKIHNLYFREKREDGERWTQEQTADVTGYSETSIKYMLQVAEALAIEPKDEELWKTPNYTEAFKLLKERRFREANQELERRRQIMNAQEQGQVPLSIVEASSDPAQAKLDEFFEKIEGGSQGQQLTSTEKKPLEILLHGKNMDFEDESVEELGKYYAVLSYGALSTLVFDYVLGSLRPAGYAILWEPGNLEDESPCQLIWNKIEFSPIGCWPFAFNYEKALVFQDPGSDYEQTPTSGSVISCHPEANGNLPFAVVDFSLSFCPPNVAVLLPQNAPVVEVAMTGRIPVWYEADDAKFAEQVKALTEFYQSQHPGCIVKINPRLAK